jgi:hypothetical protein
MRRLTIGKSQICPYKTLYATTMRGQQENVERAKYCLDKTYKPLIVQKSLHLMTH